MVTWVSLGSLLILVGLAGSGMGAVCQCTMPTWSQRNGGAIKRSLKSKFLRLDLHRGPIKKATVTLVILLLLTWGCAELARVSSNFLTGL